MKKKLQEQQQENKVNESCLLLDQFFDAILYILQEDFDKAKQLTEKLFKEKRRITDIRQAVIIFHILYTIRVLAVTDDIKNNQQAFQAFYHLSQALAAWEGDTTVDYLNYIFLQHCCLRIYFLYRQAIFFEMQAIAALILSFEDQAHQLLKEAIDFFLNISANNSIMVEKRKKYSTLVLKSNNFQVLCQYINEHSNKVFWQTLSQKFGFDTSIIINLQEEFDAFLHNNNHNTEMETFLVYKLVKLCSKTNNNDLLAKIPNYSEYTQLPLPNNFEPAIIAVYTKRTSSSREDFISLLEFIHIPNKPYLKALKNNCLASFLINYLIDRLNNQRIKQQKQQLTLKIEKAAFKELISQETLEKIKEQRKKLEEINPKKPIKKSVSKNTSEFFKPESKISSNNYSYEAFYEKLSSINSKDIASIQHALDYGEQARLNAQDENDFLREAKLSLHLAEIYLSLSDSATSNTKTKNYLKRARLYYNRVVTIVDLNRGTPHDNALNVLLDFAHQSSLGSFNHPADTKKTLIASNSSTPDIQNGRKYQPSHVDIFKQMKTLMNSSAKFPVLLPLNLTLPHPIKEFLTLIKSYYPTLVGGILLQFLGIKKSTDWDFVADLNQLQNFIQLLEKNNYKVKTIQTNAGLIIILVTFPTGETAEVTGYQLDRSANTLFDFISQDCHHRDVWINCLYCIDDQLIIANREIITDLLHKQIRFVGETQKSLRHDPVRVLRLLLLSASTKFTIARDISEVLPKVAGELNKVSPGKLRNPLYKILVSSHAYAIFEQLERYQILPALWDNLFPGTYCYFNNKYGLFYVALYRFLKACDDLIRAGIPQQFPLVTIAALALWPKLINQSLTQLSKGNLEQIFQKLTQSLLGQIKLFLEPMEGERIQNLWRHQLIAMKLVPLKENAHLNPQLTMEFASYVNDASMMMGENALQEYDLKKRLTKILMMVPYNGVPKDTDICKLSDYLEILRETANPVIMVHYFWKIIVEEKIIISVYFLREMSKIFKQIDHLFLAETIDDYIMKHHESCLSVNAVFK